MSNLIAVTQELETERAKITDIILQKNMDKAISILHGVLLTLEAQASWPDGCKWYIGDPFDGKNTRISEEE